MQLTESFYQSMLSEEVNGSGIRPKLLCLEIVASQALVPTEHHRYAAKLTRFRAHQILTKLLIIRQAAWLVAGATRTKG